MLTKLDVEELTIGQINVKTIDLGGHELGKFAVFQQKRSQLFFPPAPSARRLWKDYMTTDVSAVVFIVDVADPKRFDEAKIELDARICVFYSED